MRWIRVGRMAALALCACDRAPEPPADARPPAPVISASAQIRSDAKLASVVVVTGGANAGERLPLIVALHGLGDRPENFAGLFRDFSSPARCVMLRAPLTYGDGYSWFSFRPNQSDDDRTRALREPAARVAKEIEALARRYPSRGRAIVTGFSQGGMLAFTLASQHPKVIAAAFPVGGLLPRGLLPKTAGAAPLVVALHGAADTRVPTADGERAIAELRGIGYDARFEAFAGVGHSISPAMRERLHTLIRTEIERAP